MSIIHGPTKSKEKIRENANKLRDEYLKKGGKITTEPEGKTTSASTMKFKYRKKKSVPPL